MAFLKQNEVEGPKKKKGVAKGRQNANADPVKVVVSGPDSCYVSGLDGIEASLDWIAKGIGKLTSGEHSISLSTGYDDPVRLTLGSNDYDDTMDRAVTAIERIADSLARLAGLNRPRLECWHEQDQYMPQYRDKACDGGAPGPSADVTEQLKKCGDGGNNACM